MVGLFAPDVVLLRDRDTLLRGRDAVRSALVARRAMAAGADLWLEAPYVEECTDGAYEYGGEYQVRIIHDESRIDTLTGRYALLWADAPGGALIRVMRVVPTSDPVPPRLGGCHRASMAAFDRNRLRIWVTTPFAVGSVSAAGGLRDGLDGQSFPAVDHLGFLTVGRDRNQTGLEAAVALRLSGWFWLEVLGTVTPDRASAHGARAQGNVLADLTAEVRDFALLVSVERARFRFGAGPAFFTVKSASRISVPTAVPDPHSGNLITVWGALADSAHTGSTVGVAAHAAYAAAVSRSVFLELGVEGRFAPGGSSAVATPAASATVSGVGVVTLPTLGMSAGSLRGYLAAGISF